MPPIDALWSYSTRYHEPSSLMRVSSTWSTPRSPSRGRGCPRLRQIGRLDDARVHGEALNRLFPDDAYVLRALGAAYLRLSVRDRAVALAEKAEECFVRAAERDPGARDNLQQLRTLISARA
jgi:tetratricopeptide (TPR) repeat protein